MSDEPVLLPWQEKIVEAALQAHDEGKRFVLITERQVGRSVIMREFERRLAERATNEIRERQ